MIRCKYLSTFRFFLVSIKFIKEDSHYIFTIPIVTINRITYCIKQIDTILNRVDSDSFPNTVNEVVYQPSQFSSMWNGRVDRCYIDDYICKLVIEELRNRKNYDVIFFTADRYGNYGTPMFQIGNHYFSS